MTAIRTTVSELIEARRRAAAARQSGVARYGMHRAEMQQTDADAPDWDRAYQAHEEAPAVPGEGPWVTMTRITAERMAVEAAVRRVRSPGWQVPVQEAESWPLYRNEAVTFDTEWGSVTVGRSLARIYDLEGWPEAEVLEAMAAKQAAREGVPA